MPKQDYMVKFFLVLEDKASAIYTLNSWKTFVKLMSFLQLSLKLVYYKLLYFWNMLLLYAIKFKTKN
jgi:hypothetical protein